MQEKGRQIVMGVEWCRKGKRALSIRALLESQCMSSEIHFKLLSLNFIILCLLQIVNLLRGQILPKNKNNHPNLKVQKDVNYVSFFTVILLLSLLLKQVHSCVDQRRYLDNLFI